MQELVTTFHIDWHLIVAQLVNFAIVFLVLWKFALKPLTKTMQERTATIEQSLKEAEEIKAERASSAEATKRQIAETQRKALEIIEKAKKQAEEKRQEMLNKAKQEVEGVVMAAKNQIQAEKESALRDAHREVASLVVSGVAKVLGKNMDEKTDRKILKERLHRT